MFLLLQKDMTDFENSLKEFGSYVPALTTMVIKILPTELTKFYTNIQ